MGDIYSIGGQKLSKKPTKKELLEQRVATLEQHVAGLMQEIWVTNANAVALFRALIKNKALTEDDIKESWEENVRKPNEEAQKEMDKATGTTTANDTEVDAPTEGVDPVTDVPPDGPKEEDEKA